MFGYQNTRPRTLMFVGNVNDEDEDVSTYYLYYYYYMSSSSAFQSSSLGARFATYFLRNHLMMIQNEGERER